MKNKIFYVIILIIFSACSLTREAKIAKNKEILLKNENNFYSNNENSIYIPEAMDARYYRTGKYYDCVECEKPDFEMVNIVKAFYDLYKILTPEEVKELLRDPSPVLRVYAYFYYIGKFNDVNIEYLNEQIESKEEVSVNGRPYYVADPMILTAIGCIIIQYIAFTEFIGINPTWEQRYDLYKRYLKRGKHKDYDLTYYFEAANERELYREYEANE